ncbi:MAG: 30S ribosome-binding factor RbfA [Myxococcales bacterium]
MVHFRRQRLGDQLQVELAELIQRELKDPRVGFVTVTEVRMSPDLKHARVYVSVFEGEEQKKEESIAALQRAEGFLRRSLGGRLRLRYVPELRFVIDDTLDRSARIEALLDDSDANNDG